MLLLNIYRKFREKKLYSQLGKCGKGVFIGFPNMISRPELIYMGDFTRILGGSNLILYQGKFIVGETVRKL